MIRTRDEGPSARQPSEGRGRWLGTICIYQATDVDKVKEHAKRVDMPADEVLEIADTVIIRPDSHAQETAA
jgi:sporulation protein YlmC with PRC-barrel domain